MKKSLWIFAFLFVITSQLSAFEMAFEGKAGNFFPTNHRFHQVYPAGAFYAGEVSCSLFSPCVQGWVSGGYFSKHGKERHRYHDGLGYNRLTLIPITFGLKYLYPVESCGLKLYCGAGGQYAHLHSKGRSKFLCHPVNKWGWGGVINGGCIFDLCNNFFTDVFVEYSFLSMKHTNSHNGERSCNFRTKLNGWTAGVGLGYRFNFL